MSEEDTRTAARLAAWGAHVPTAFRDDVVFWVVPKGEPMRHGTTTRPGALPAGREFTMLCARRFKVPLATPWPREPISKSITEQCEECSDEYERLGRPSTVWDF